MTDHINCDRWTTSQWNYYEDGWLDYNEGNKLKVVNNDIHGIPYRMGYEDARALELELKENMRNECFEWSK